MKITGPPPPPGTYFFHRYLTKQTGREIVTTFKIKITDSAETYELLTFQTTLQIKHIQFQTPPKTKKNKKNKTTTPTEKKALIWTHSSKIGSMYHIVPAEINDTLP
jgi:hypothetical protein